MEWHVEAFEDLDAVRAVWVSLFNANPGVGPFMTWDYTKLWWQHFGATYKPLILIATHKEGYRVLLPLMREGNQLRWAATPGSDSVSCLYDVYACLPEAIYSIAAFLRQKRWSKLSLSYLPADQAAIFIQAFSDKPCRTDTSSGSPYIEIKGRSWDEYFGSLSASLRKDTRKPHNRLNQNGLSLRFETINDPKTLEEKFPIIEAITAACSMQEKHDLLKDNQRTFLLDICREYAAKGWLCVDIAYIADQPAAYQIAFTIEGVFGCWRTAYDEQFQAYSPGKLLQVYLMQRCFERGDRIFDFMHGLESYKLQWTDQLQSLTYLVFYGNWLRGRFAHWQTSVNKVSLQQRLVKKLRQITSKIS